MRQSTNVRRCARDTHNVGMCMLDARGGGQFFRDFFGSCKGPQSRREPAHLPGGCRFGTVRLGRTKVALGRQSGHTPSRERGTVEAVALLGSSQSCRHPAGHGPQQPRHRTWATAVSAPPHSTSSLRLWIAKFPRCKKRTSGSRYSRRSTTTASPSCFRQMWASIVLT